MIELIAYHEAGHALVARLMGGTVMLVTIEPDNDDGPQRQGDTQVLWRRQGLSEREFAERTIQVSLAGPVAEMIYRGEPFHPGLVAEWAADWQDAWAAAELIQRDQRRRLAFLEGVSVQLYHQLNGDDLWAALAAVADHLLAHETLEAEQVEEILADWL